VNHKKTVKALLKKNNGPCWRLGQTKMTKSRAVILSWTQGQSIPQALGQLFKVFEDKINLTIVFVM
jgi:hypothetical protein